jgi:protein-S-isoprenylcysteine O-methyltransferase Ste14
MGKRQPGEKRDWVRAIVWVALVPICVGSFAAPIAGLINPWWVVSAWSLLALVGIGWIKLRK